MTGWMPIETAPKDGTPILCCRDVPRQGRPPLWGRVRIARWYGGLWLTQQPGGYLNDEVIVGWMPLPEPPQ